MFKKELVEEEVEKKIMEREKRKVFKELCSDLRHERRTIGIKFWDANYERKKSLCLNISV